MKTKVKTKKDTVEVFSVRDWLLLIFLTLIAVGFTVLLSTALVSLAQIRTLACTRLEPAQYNCVLQSKVLGLVPVSTTPIDLRGAYLDSEVVERTSSDGKSTGSQTLYSVVLQTNGGDVHLDITSSASYWLRQRIVDRINTFVQDRQVKSLRAHSDFLAQGILMCVLPFFLLIALALSIACLKIIWEGLVSGLRRRRPKSILRRSDIVS